MWSENCKPLALQSQLQTNLSLFEKVETLLTLAHFYVFDQSSDQYIQQLDSLLIEHPEWAVQQAHLLFLKACKRQMVGDWDGSTEKLEEALIIYREYGELRGEVEAMIGTSVIRAMTVRHDEGISILEQCRKKIKEHALPQICYAYMLNHFAMMHLMVELYDLAESYGRRAYDYAFNLERENEGVVSKNVIRVQMSSTWTLTYALLLLEQFDEAIQLAEQCLSLVKPLNVPYWEARFLQIIANSLIESGNSAVAIEKLTNILKGVLSKPEIPSIYYHCHALLGIALTREGRHEEAEPILLRAIKQYNSIRSIGLIYLGCLKSLATIAKSQGRYEDAFSYLEQNEQVRTGYKRKKSELKLAHLTEVHKYDLKKQEADMLRISNEKLTEANHLLQQAYEEQSELVKLVTHDIYNPLSSIVLRTQLATRFVQRERIDKVVESIGAIRQSADYIGDIVAQFQMVDKLDQEQLKLDRQILSVQDVIIAAIERNQPAATIKHIQLVFDKEREMSIWACELAMMQVLDNVLSNAIKYSFPDSVVQIKATQHEDIIEIAFVDQGVGIDQGETHKLFSKFGRLDSSRPTSDERSTGLGLYIVQKLIHKMDGEIMASSDGLGTGTTFTIQLPIPHSKMLAHFPVAIAG